MSEAKFVPSEKDQKAWDRWYYVYMAVLVAIFPIRIAFVVPYLLAQGLMAAIDWLDRKTLDRLANFVADKRDDILQRVRRERREWQQAQEDSL